MKIERVTYMVAGYFRKKSFPSNKFAPKDLKRKSQCFFPSLGDMAVKPERG